MVFSHLLLQVPVEPEKCTRPGKRGVPMIFPVEKLFREVQRDSVLHMDHISFAGGL
jgi:hypothetical protein